MFQSKNLTAGSPIAITNLLFEPAKQFGFTALFLKMPDFELPDYHSLNVAVDTDDDLLTEISKWLLAHTPFIIPDAFVENELRYTEPETQQQCENSNLEQKHPLRPSEPQTFTAAERHAAAERVKLMLILKKIAADEGITVDDREIDNRLQKVAAENGMTVAEVKNSFLSDGNHSRLSDLLLAEQVLNYLKTAHE